MLYVFNILPGVMLNFDVQIALESVLTLKKHIQAKCNIPINKQVLLINGGTLLDNDFRVCNYNGIGTDSTPIYLFNLYSLENPLPSQQAATLSTQQSSPNQQLLSTSPSSNYQFANVPVLSNAPSAQFIISLHSQQIQDEQQIKLMKNKVVESLDMDASYSTIVTRTEISKQIMDLTAQQLQQCEQLIRDQHLQYQGWCCVIANLEDIGAVFDTNVERTLKVYRTFLDNKDDYNKLLSKLNIDIQLLEMIPVLETFHDSQQDTQSDSTMNIEEVDELRKAEIENLDEPDALISQSQSSKCQSKNEMTLLNWIHSRDDHFTLNNLMNSCMAAIEHFDEQCFEDLNRRIDDVRVNLRNEENKKIRKIEDRLYQLEELHVRAKKIVNDTNGLTSAFIQNQNSAANARDDSIFADLCHSHQTQLKIILQNLIDLNNIKSRYLKAKSELIYSLHTKLKNIILLESDLSSLNATLIICAENLRKLLKTVQVLEQVHRTPKIYFLSINEILRRNLFNKRFGPWSQSLHTKCSDIYEKESASRKKFDDKVSNHFLTMMFSGLNDEFPQFFLPELPKFDQQIVKISANDLCRLKEVLPKLNSLIDSLENKDYVEYVDELKINEELLDENLVFEMMCMNCFKQRSLTDDNQSGNTNQSESATDFEKIFEELDLINTNDLIMKSASSKSNQENEMSADSKVLKKQESTELAKEAVENLIVENESDVVEIFAKDIDLDRKANNIKILKEKIAQKLEEHEVELRRQFDAQVEQLKLEFSEQMKQELNKLEQKLKGDHKLEIDSIRSRFKLACALDRSSLESSVKYSHTSMKSTKDSIE